MSQELVTKKVDKQNIHETTDFELRFLGLDLDYYKRRISPEQLRLLMEMLVFILRRKILIRRICDREPEYQIRKLGYNHRKENKTCSADT